MVKPINKKMLISQFPFSFDDIGKQLSAGEYTIETEEESIAGLSFPTCSFYENQRRLMMHKFASAILGALLLVALLAIASAQTSTATSVPDNATKQSYGQGWSCESGYREAEGACAAIVAPENAYLNNRNYGSGWDCRRGFEPVDGRCQKIAIPANAYLKADGQRWECERGFARQSGTCRKIKLPVNGYLSVSSYGDGWACLRGYRKISNDCKLINVPENGYLTDLPYGTGWECLRGFSSQASACRAVIVPENAHLTNSGNDWRCDPPFEKRMGQCVSGSR